MNSKLLSAFGMCKRAGKLICGTELVCESLAGKHPPLAVYYAQDASENTRKKITDKCAFYHVPCKDATVSAEDLANALGKKNLLVCVAVCDENLLKLVENSYPSHENMNH